LKILRDYVFLNELRTLQTLVADSLKDRSSHHFDTTQQCDRRTDGQHDRHLCRS